MNDLMSTEERQALEAAVQDENATRDRQFEQRRRDAQAVFRSVEGWPYVRDRDAWLETVESANTDYQSGRFLIERLGAERHLDPELMATLLQLRRALIAETGATTAAETMLVDLAVLSYHNTLRIQGWVGNMALRIEHELFGQESPTAAFSRKNGRGSGLVVEEQLQRLAEQLLPLLDRGNRMVIRNLKAMKEQRQRAMPNVAIERVEQLNMADQQVNVTVHEDDVEAGS